MLKFSHQMRPVYVLTIFPCSIMGGIRVGAGIRSARSTAGSGPTLAGKTRPDPALYKTVICRNWRSGECSYGARCAFAHGADELRKVRLVGCLAAF